MALSLPLRGDHAARLREVETAAEEIAAAKRLQAAGDHAAANGLLDLAATRLRATTARTGRAK